MINLEIKSTETTNFTLRMTVSQRLELECIAKKQGRTITNLINYVMSQYIEDYNKQKKYGRAINLDPVILSF